MLTVPTEHQEWVRRKGPVEHVSFRAFVDNFDLSDRKLAVDAYYVLLECGAIRTRRRDALKNSFVHFRKHYEERFWTKRAPEVHTGLVANRTGLEVHKLGETTSSVTFNNSLSRIRGEFEHGPHNEDNEVARSVLGTSSAPQKPTPTVLKRGRSRRNDKTFLMCTPSYSKRALAGRTCIS
ncbi:hypothetical protein EDD21DRAFT_82857 [Dissophora ornata]|nr:hypothetical protein EDD21DRAFT_82857 [Dissophora ornata]